MRDSEWLLNTAHTLTHTHSHTHTHTHTLTHNGRWRGARCEVRLVVRGRERVRRESGEWHACEWHACEWHACEWHACEWRAALSPHVRLDSGSRLRAGRLAALTARSDHQHRSRLSSLGEDAEGVTPTRHIGAKRSSGTPGWRWLGRVSLGVVVGRHASCECCPSGVLAQALRRSHH